MKNSWRTLHLCLWQRFLSGILILVGLPGSAFALPSFEEVKESWVRSDSVLLDRHGEPIHELRMDNQRRRLDWVTLGEVSPALIESLTAAEDKRFHNHRGVDWRSMAGALARGISLEGFRGASTITMQLAALLDKRLQGKGGRKSLPQKIKQILAALDMERHWSKGQILEAYLNLVSFRGELQGIKAASKGLFGKEPHGLSQTESLILASLVRASNAPSEAVKSRALLIGRSLGWGQLEKELDKNLRLLSLGGYLLTPLAAGAPHAARILFKGQPNGSRVVSSLEASIQRYVTDRLAHHLELLRAQNMKEGAALVVENRSGEVLAYVSLCKRSPQGSQVDGVRARRQAGSSLKPFLYAQALDERILTPASLLDDSPLDIPVPNGIYSPRNYDNLYRGPVSVRTALASSMNIPAVKALGLVGAEAYLGKLRTLGFSHINESGDFFGPSLALGSLDVSLWELVNAYRTLANGGMHGELSLTTVWGDSLPSKRVFSKEAAFLISDILSDREARSAGFGFGNPLSTRFWSAVKTGTSKDMRDNWCVGYTNGYTVGVWVGNFSGESMWNVSGVSGAAPVWVEIMNFLHSERTPHSPIPPEGVVKREIRYPQGPEPPRQEWFLLGTEPHGGILTLNKRAARITYPPSGAIMALDPDIPAEQQKVFFLSEGFREGMKWRLNGELLPGAGRSLPWSVREGRHLLSLLDRDGKTLDQVSFLVRGPGTWKTLESD